MFSSLVNRLSAYVMLISVGNTILIVRFPSNNLIALENIKLECGAMPNVMVALPNIGGALCSTPQFG